MKKVLEYLRGILIIAVLWKLASLAVGGRAVPPPEAVIPHFFTLAAGDLPKHAAASLARVLASLAFAALPAVPLGLALGRSKTLDSFLTPSIYLLYPVPKIALLPVVMLLFGMGDVSKILVVSLVLFFQILVAVRDGARAVAPEYLVSARSLGAGRLQTLLYVVFPAVLPPLFSALRVGTGTALAVLFFAETFFTKWGLGYFIVDSWMRIDYPGMFAGILAISLLGFALFRCTDFLERLVCPWSPR